MEDELLRLKGQLAEEQRRRAEEQQKREEEQRRREAAEHRERVEQEQRREEQRKRYDAEHAASLALKQTLRPFLEGCHGLSRQVKPVDDLSSATTGRVTNEIGRFYPQTILPWNDFPTQQKAMWKRFPRESPAWSSRAYPSKTNLDYLRTRIEPIGSEDELRFLERLLVEDMVRALFDEFGKETQSDAVNHAVGRISFENQARFRGEEMTAAMKGMTVHGDVGRQPRNTRADQFCVLRNHRGIARPVVVIEYKSPHKLTVREICIGLRGEIRPEIDVMHREDDDFEFLCKYLMTAVLAQLFSYMIDKGVRYGYVSTGEVYVFMHIPADPQSVYYSVNIPRHDFDEDVENQLERTAVSQVFAFIQQALSDEPPDQVWMTAARSQLKRWNIEYVDILKMIPETERKSRDHSIYKPGRWAPSHRTSPVILRRPCSDGTDTAATRAEDSDTEDPGEDGDVNSPSTQRKTRSQTRDTLGAAPQKGKSKTSKRGDGGAPRGTRSTGEAVHGRRIEAQPYCTHKCLLGLCQGRSLDRQCPNLAAHGHSHIQPRTFLRLLRKQLAVDRGKYADCCALYVHGSRGALLKVRLTSHGYTMVAKGVDRDTVGYLEHEKRVYARLEGVQGRNIPVCCGLIDLELPYIYDGTGLTHLLIMSWAGRSLAVLKSDELTSLPSPEELARQCRETMDAIHERSILHCDVEPRNMLYSPTSKSLMLVDFERSELDDRPALSELSSNRKRKRLDDGEGKNKRSRFTKEALSAESSMRRACQLDERHRIWK